MAGEILSFLIENLWDLLSHEYEILKGVADQANELKTDLKTLKLFLKDAEAKKHTKKMVRDYLERINEIVLDGEDTIEALILKDHHDSITKRAGNVLGRRKIASEIGSLHKEIVKVINYMESFGVIKKINEDVKDPQSSQHREEYPQIHENNLVGMEENVQTLIGYLVERDDVQVVSITGMGGLGKTTLARQAFHDNLVKKKFDRFAWVCVSKVCDWEKVWQAILKSFRPKEEQTEIQNMAEATLQGELFRLLETSNSLIVLDGISNEEDWDKIKRIFPFKPGSKVLLTSQNESVAGREVTCKNFRPKCLSEPDSWTLFQRIAMPPIKDASELTDDDKEMETMGKQMIEKCRGLPLAIRVLGGLLAANYRVDYWKRVSVNIGSHLVGRNYFSDDKYSSLGHVLSLSFEELGGYLKYCVLYLAHFPEDQEINVEDLANIWAAEGILRYGDTDSIRDVGDSCIEELVRRNMVISERSKTTGRFETCSLHDLMRNFCLSKAKEEYILNIVGISSSQTSLSRRFVLHDPKAVDVERDINNSKARSLVVIWKSNFYISLLAMAEEMFYWGVKKDIFTNTFEREDGDQFRSVSNLDSTRLQFLRVLHLRGVVESKGSSLSESIGKLIHLRYLNLHGARVSRLHSSLKDLKLLIYLNLNVIEHCRLPTHTFFLGMIELKFLALPRGLLEQKKKLELNRLVKLETLVNFSTEYCRLEDLRGMAKLRTLGINITGETSLETLSASIDGLSHLENLDIVYARAKEGKKGRSTVYEGDMRTIGWSTLLEFITLKRLKLSTNIPLLSDELQFPSRLTSLYLLESGLKEDPMPILEKLVHLKDVVLGDGSFSGRRMVCSRGGFPQLQKLELRGLEALEVLTVEEGSMPLLYTLSIDNCQKLKEFPDGLPFITSLKDLNVINMGEKWKERLSEGGEEYYKVQHIPSVEIVYISF